MLPFKEVAHLKIFAKCTKIAEIPNRDCMVCKALHREYGYIAVKIAKKENNNSLYDENAMYEFLFEKPKSSIRVPNVYEYKDQADFAYLVMELLGPSLQELFDQCSGKFSLKTTLMLAIQMMAIFKDVHKFGVMHRNIKPGNFCMGFDKKSDELYLIDFGESEKYIKYGKHMEYDRYSGTVGRPKFKTFRRCQSRRTDLESIGYLLSYFLKGSLPWENCYDYVEEKQKPSNLSTITKGYPFLLEYFQCVLNLGFDEKPDYAFLKSLFEKEFEKAGFQLDYHYDWSQIIEKKRLNEFMREIIDETIETIFNFQLKSSFEKTKDKFFLFERCEQITKISNSNTLVFSGLYKGYRNVAIKCALTKVETAVLDDEQMICDDYLHGDEDSAVGIPKIYEFVSEGNFSFFMMAQLGPSLKDLFQQSNMKFSLKTTLMLATQMLNILEYVHGCGIIHRNIEPGNFCIGLGRNKEKLYIIDFANAEIYDEDGKHKKESKIAWQAGHIKFKSFRECHSRRTDLESIGYLLSYLLKGSLPWEDCDDSEEANKMKSQLNTPMILSEGYPFLLNYFDYVSKLGFDEIPDYAHLKSLFKSDFEMAGFKLDYCYDWIPIKENNGKLEGKDLEEFCNNIVSEDILEKMLLTLPIRKKYFMLRGNPNLFGSRKKKKQYN